MTNSGKEFGQLVRQIEETLLPEGFTITANEHIFDDAGNQLAEFDIQITGYLGSTHIKWLIECRDRPSQGSLDPTLPNKYKRLVVMGGSIRGIGNVTTTAEFNAYTDPEAAVIVFDAWPGLTLISWETTLDHGFTAQQVETLMGIDSPRAEFFRRITRRTIDSLHQFLRRQELLTPDGLAVAVALEPDIVRKAEMHHVQVELAGHHTRGQTPVDWFDQTGLEPNVNLVLEVDTKRLWELMQAAIR